MDKEPITKSDTWYLTGIPGIDAQHKELFTLLSALLDGPKKKKAAGSAQKSLQEIIDCLKTHISTEESLLEMISFPRLAKHRAQHIKLIKCLTAELKILDKDENVDIRDFAREFIDGLHTHIADFDRDVANHIDTLMTLRKKFSLTALGARVLTE